MTPSRTDRPVRTLIWLRRRVLARATILLTGHQLGEAAVPVVLGLAIDDALSPPRLGRLLFWLAVLGVDFVVLSLCWRFGSRLGAGVRFGIAHDLCAGVAARVLDARGLAADRPPGELLTIAVSDARRVGDAVRTSLSACASVVALAAAVVAIALLSVILAVVVFAGAVATLAAVALLSRPVEARGHAEQEANARAASMAVDLIAGLRVLAGLRAGGTAGARYRAISGAAAGSAVRAADAEAAVSGITALVIGVYFAAVAWVSTALALDGRLSVGAVIGVLGLSQLLFGPLQVVAQAVASARRGRASAARITAVLRAPAILHGARAQAIPADRDLSVESVRADGLDGVALHVRAGTIHGVVTDTVTSAESLMRVLAGEAAMLDGRVLVGEVDLAQVQPGARRRSLLVWPHHGMPPGATVAELVGTSRHGAEIAHAAIAAAGAGEIVGRIPGGLESAVAERGVSLSGGERQRLALARVLAERASIVVLHEPTSAIDAVTELAIADGIKQWRRGLTTVFVTTSPTLLGVCDEVSLVVGGRRLACGPHGELLAHRQYREAIDR